MKRKFQQSLLLQPLIALLILALVMAFTGCQATQAAAADATPAPEATTEATTEAATEAAAPAPATQDFGGRTLTLVTTTSTENSGLLDAILPDFKTRYNCDIKVVAVGSGAAFEMAQKGEADVIVVHAPKSEEQFMTDGYGRDLSPLMYNDFVIVGPGTLKELAITEATDTLGALKAIQDKGLKFISRGDDSGTHKKELQLWEKAQLTPSGDSYLSVGKGMGEVLTMAEELQAYTLTDRATYLSMKAQLSLGILVAGDKLLYNPYSVITLSQEKFPELNHDMADAFAAWLLSENTQATIAEFGVAEYGEPLFYLFNTGAPSCH